MVAFMIIKSKNSASVCVIDWILIGIKQFSYISHKYPEKVYINNLGVSIGFGL